jgi:hypothetical protein
MVATWYVYIPKFLIFVCFGKPETENLGIFKELFVFL